MVNVKIYSIIANNAHRWHYSWDGYEDVFSLQGIKDLFSKYANETDFYFDIHCPGGEVNEGFAIYDALRTSGKNIHMNIDGDCHSMAVVLLLAAPFENRTANPNCRALIHKVYGYATGGTADELESAAKETRDMQNSILGIYVDRTGKPREELEAIMNEGRQHSVQELLEWGFISKINSYNTNMAKGPKGQANKQTTKNNVSMEKKKNVKARAGEFMNSVLELLGVATNYEFVDENGETLFTTEAEDDTLEVGMSASPDGTFTLTDGRVVTIADGVITEIKDAEVEETTEEEVENLKAENKELREALTEAVNLIKDLRSEIKSNFIPTGRQNNSGAGTKVLTKEERKANLKEAVKKGRKQS